MKRLAQVALVGRPNVGKSTLYNAMARSRKAIVADQEGVTRDRRYQNVTVDIAGEARDIRLVDTGGWLPEEWRKRDSNPEIMAGVERQVFQALQESDAIIQVVDIRAGLTPLDEMISRSLRRLNKPYFLAANKADQEDGVYSEGEFYALGPTGIIPVSAEHRLGIQDLWDAVYAEIPAELTSTKLEDLGEAVVASNEFRICIVDRPNAGKSSLLNAFLGEERVIATDIPGTTTDPVDVEFVLDGKKFILIDTAGIRRHAKRRDDVENLAVMYAKRNLEQADLAFLVLDAEEGITSYDETIAALIEDAGCAAIIVANKWDKAPDAIKSSPEGLEKFSEMAKKQMPFLEFAPLIALSAMNKKMYGAAEGEDKLDHEPWPLPKKFADIWPFVAHIVQSREQKIPSKELSELIRQVMATGPRMVDAVGSLRRPHQVGNRPPQFMVYVKAPDKVPEAFRRYLSRLMRERYGYRGHPIRWVFKRN